MSAALGYIIAGLLTGVAGVTVVARWQRWEADDGDDAIEGAIAFLLLTIAWPFFVMLGMGLLVVRIIIRIVEADR